MSGVEVQCAHLIFSHDVEMSFLGIKLHVWQYGLVGVNGHLLILTHTGPISLHHQLNKAMAMVSLKKT